MKTVVITGSTRGIGYGLADAFLEKGCNVIVSGRNEEGVEMALGKLAQKYPEDRFIGQICDVTHFEQVQKLWDVSVTRFGVVDIWINNAGVAHAMSDFWEIEPKMMDQVVHTNTLGTLYGSKVAISGMLEQGFGAVYFMEGAGSTGRSHPGMILYASTKRGLNYLLEGLVKEVEDTPIIVSGLSPGMVVTDFLINQRERGEEDWERTKRIFNILGDKVDTVTPWLVDKILANRKNGVSIRWSSPAKMMWRFATARFNKRDLFVEED